MKKKNILLLSLISSIGLISCGTNERYNSNVLIDYLGKITTKEYSTFSARGEGHVLDVNDVEVFKKKIDLETSSSIFLSLPLKVDVGNFYYEEENSLSSNCQFYSIYTKMVNLYGYNSLNCSIDETNNLVLQSFGSSLQISLKNVYDEVASISARFNMKFVYSNEGYLIEESFYTTNDGKDPQNESLNLSATYTYA